MLGTGMVVGWPRRIFCFCTLEYVDLRIDLVLEAMRMQSTTLPCCIGL